MGNFNLEEAFSSAVAPLGDADFDLDDMMQLNSSLKSALEENNVRRNPNNIKESQSVGGSAKG